MVTIKDVAREAAVSGSTVSHVINGTRFVAPETAERVRNAIEKLGFSPNGVARALKGNRTRTIGMVVTSSTNPFFAALIHGVEATCFARGYSLILCNSEDDRAKFSSYLKTLRAKRIDALIVLTANQQPGMTAELAATAGIPVIALDEETAGEATSITDDSEAGGALAARFLAERGFTRIACITGPANHQRSEARLKGFAVALGAHDVYLPGDSIVPADLTVTGGHRAMTRLLARPDATRPEAVFCFNDVMAIGALSAAYEKGFGVPADISVMGYDDVELAAYTAPPLTTIHQPVNELGQQAANLAIDHLENGTPLPAAVRLKPTLVERRSVGCPAPSRS